MEIKPYMDGLEKAGAKIINLFGDDSKFQEVCSILFRFQNEVETE